MTNPTISLIEQRVSANLFDASHVLTDAEIERLVHLATRAPTAYNLQNWRFIAVRTPESKARLRSVAQDQPKVSDAAVTFIICGVLPDHEILAERLRPSVEAGFMPAAMVVGWQEGARQQYADPRMARDEAVRSATFGAATLMHAAEAMGLASGPMVGFDAGGVARAFGLMPVEVPVLLLAVGRAAPGNWPQKPRRPLAEILEVA
ncbi:nitroreductase family protein [Sandaracinobacter sp. RS1-74]|uniref:nitroreductase family protein n=1 Tax=Sandaracinobacteroides sayramensis TaxID=2913411 RepID=UPI001EDACCE9|nr:nitroreductase family protein [Sandaracinobacteroides sayramensis]MCG2842316.1 nitroreductase family protein [Sandaracinobacteroides sayramensis]